MKRKLDLEGNLVCVLIRKGGATKSSAQEAFRVQHLTDKI